MEVKEGWGGMCECGTERVERSEMAVKEGWGGMCECGTERVGRIEYGFDN